MHPTFIPTAQLPVRQVPTGRRVSALDLIKNKEVKAILGPWYSIQAHFLIEIGRKAQVPIVTFSATSPSLSSLHSPYFFRATHDDSSQVHAITAIIKAFGWKEVVPMYMDNILGQGIIPFLSDSLQGIGVHIPYRIVISAEPTDDEISEKLLRMMTLSTRVFVIHMVEFLGSRVLAKAKELGLMKQGYVWILTCEITNALISRMGETGFETIQGVLGVKTYIPRSKELESFRSRFMKQFPTSELDIIGLRAYDAATALAMAVEEAGTDGLSSSKVGARRNTTELEALSVSQYGQKLVQTLSEVRFKGLYGDFHFVGGQLQASVFEIVNVIGNGGRSVGFWTHTNGLVKTLNQKSRSMTGFSTWKDHLRPIIWPGDSTFVPKGWEIPTNGKRLRIGVPIHSSFSQFVKVVRDPITNATTATGFCIDFFEAVTKVMPYDITYEFIPFGTPEGRPSGNYDDLLYQVYLGRYDAVVGDTTINANRSSYVDFSLPYTPSGVGLIVPLKDNVKRSSTIFLTPLTLGLWLISLLSFFIVGLVVWILEHRINPDFHGPGKYQASTIFWFAFSIMVFAPGERVLSFWARLVVITWYFVVLVLAQSYTASLASLLTSQQLHPTITNMKSLLAKGEPVGCQRTSFMLAKARESGFLESNLVPFSSAEECDDLLSKGPTKGGVSAVFLEVPYVKLFLGQYCNKYKMVEVPFKFDGFGFVFPISSPLVADVSRAILKVEESNKAIQLENAWFKKIDESCPEPIIDPDPNPSISFRRLGLDSFWLLFLVAATVCIIALGKFTFFFLKENREILYQRNLQDLWKKFLQPDENSYINRVERCPCSSSQPRWKSLAEKGRQIFPEIV
ncbi:PREDICTED: glutamate receptor 2.1-like isoform X2 [Tarenaya hassleriana]|uniref:glutamate receptor 2.1-like isoform X2 n=1 Tax=Tarenaya hassleriana TaxID=28532 RepID=UPI00053C3D86|nr:PREDICTED: glutamate receptor 2.1-like isoform X2 [Tarenaya hassleriana]